MPQKTLTSNTGVEMPAIGLGVFQTPPDSTTAAVEEAFRLGYRHIDTPAVYLNEKPARIAEDFDVFALELPPSRSPRSTRSTPEYAAGRTGQRHSRNERQIPEA
ncbi:hypothetical protein OPAG_01632 [Rhodococcus opacus PD630]|uniref:hypothetical protein n=1 Tax=Rhodococcus TaxID=1827 RepID=UPI00029CD480|nr:2,5-diketo-D-gluconic acid reductase A [Rhodococcus opacus PD630]EHI39625.1 hypothetical protein OPAG_01632 [Rhodococcus opacus PD630]UDG96627.1 hypothetical protein K2Z90_006867 [Rhodococcus opacus PD630]